MLVPRRVLDPPVRRLEVALSRRREPRAGLLAAALVAVTAAVAVATVVVDVRGGVLGGSWPLLVSTGVVALVGALLAGRRPRHPVGWLLLATGLPFLVGQAAEAVAQLGLDHPPPGRVAQAALWVANWIYPPALVPLFVLVALTFPDGRLPSPRWRVVVVLAVALAGVQALVAAFGQRTLVLGGVEHPNPHAVAALGAVAPAVATWTALVLVGCSLVATLSLVLRWRGAPRQERQQIMWVVLALVVLAAALGVDASVALLAPSLYPVVFPLVQLAPVVVPLAIAVAVMRHELFDIEVLVGRALVYALVTLLLLAGYVVVVTWTGWVLPRSAGIVAPVAGTAVVAVAFAPLREAVQRLVDRRLFGDRARPYVAMTRLARQLQEASAPEQVLTTLVGSTAHAVRSPYVAIELDGRSDPVAEHGTRPDAGLLAAVALTHAGAPLGRLVVAGRGREALDAADLRLLADLALPIGAAVHAVGLSLDLHRSREQMVRSVEEERRRVGRDLHDGLGPRLAAISMQAELARDLSLVDPARSHALLGELMDETALAVQETRRVAHAHRPPALDTLGLVAALESHLAHVAAVPVRFEVPRALPALPAAVEVAAYRIALEAIQNVAAHARARSCVLRLTHDRNVLSLEVVDDGVGIASDRPCGLGLQSMTERAAELGGGLTVQPAPHGCGTVVRAELPWRARDAVDDARAPEWGPP